MPIIEDLTTTHEIKLTHWSHSQDTSYRKCPMQWYRRAVLGLQPMLKSPPLHRGLSVHNALEQFHTLSPRDRELDVLLHYYNGEYQSQRAPLLEHPLTTVEHVKTFDEWNTSIGIPTIYLLWDIYGKDEEIPALSYTELTLEVPLPGTDTVYQTRLDALVLNVSEPFIFETKTMSRDNRAQYDQFDLQAPRNLWAVNNALELSTPIRTLRYNFVVFPTKRNPGKVSRQDFTPSDAEILDAVADLPYVVKEAQHPSKVIYKKWDKLCPWCEYYEIDKIEKFGGDPSEYVETQFTVRENAPGTEEEGVEVDNE